MYIVLSSGYDQRLLSLYVCICMYIYIYIYLKHELEKSNLWSFFGLFSRFFSSAEGAINPVPHLEDIICQWQLQVAECRARNSKDVHEHVLGLQIGFRV